MSPTVLRQAPYPFFFYAGDKIERDDQIAKFWLDPIRLQNSGGFSRSEISRIQEIVRVCMQIILLSP